MGNRESQSGGLAYLGVNVEASQDLLRGDLRRRMLADIASDMRIVGLEGESLHVGVIFPLFDPIHLVVDRQRQRLAKT